MVFEDKMKNRDNEFLYDKCVKQYHCIMNYQSKMREYKEHIEELEKENKKLKLAMQDTYDKANDTCGELQHRIDIVSRRISNFCLIFDEDVKMISSADSIMVKLRYYSALLDGKIPLTMTVYEYSKWEKENRKGDIDNE